MTKGTITKGVIFDMDGLMLDTEKLLAKYWMQAAHEAGFPMEMEHVLGIRSLSAVFAKPKLQQIFGEAFDYEAIRARRRELTARHLEEHGIETKPGLMELLEFLKESGRKIAVATATDKERTDLYLRQVGVHHFFDAFVCGDMVTKGKPDPEIYLTASHSLGLAPEECMALEDSPNGIRSAHAAGCKAVMIPDLSHPEKELFPLLYSYCAGLSGVIDLIREEDQLAKEYEDGKTQRI